jgi:hypothetical protein
VLRPAQSALVAAGVAYLVVLGWAVANLSYDIWGVLVLGPPMVLFGMLGLRRLFAGELASLYWWLVGAMLVKTFAGSAARYWVAFDAYGGSADAGRYHDYGRLFAGRVRDGELNIGSVLPGGQGTVFIERLTSFLYFFVGSSKLAAFALFSWGAFWGVALTVKAACVAVPGLARLRYAVLATLAPSVVFWPSSIGKEAWMTLTLGLANYGIARMVLGRRTGRVPPIVWAALGVGGAALVRPHIAGIWVGGVVAALLVLLFRGRGTTALAGETSGRGTQRFVALVGLAVVALGALVVGQATLKYLDPSGEETDSSISDRIDAISEEVNRRTEQGGSEFAPPVLGGPQDWPLAIARTLTRPLLIEANDLESLLPALEMTVFLALCVVSWRRVFNLPRLLVRNPYVMFATVVVLLYGLAFTSIANLGILTRQRSLVLPLLFLLPCLPRRRDDVEPEVVEDEHAHVHALAGLARLEDELVGAR